MYSIHYIMQNIGRKVHTTLKALELLLKTSTNRAPHHKNKTKTKQAAAIALAVCAINILLISYAARRPTKSSVCMVVGRHISLIWSTV